MHHLPEEMDVAAIAMSKLSVQKSGTLSRSSPQGIRREDGIEKPTEECTNKDEEGGDMELVEDAVKGYIEDVEKHEEIVQKPHSDVEKEEKEENMSDDEELESEDEEEETDSEDVRCSSSSSPSSSAFAWPTCLTHCGNCPVFYDGGRERL